MAKLYDKYNRFVEKREKACDKLKAGFVSKTEGLTLLAPSDARLRLLLEESDREKADTQVRS